MSLPRRSQSALEYMMTYGWAILVIVIVAAVLYSLGIFSPSSAITSSVTGFSNLGSVAAQVIPNSGLVLSLGDSTGYNINITNITISLDGKTSTIRPDSLISSSSSSRFFIPFSSVPASSSYSFSVTVSYTEPGQIFPGPYVSTGTVYGTSTSSSGFYQAITITNSQTTPTPAPFQQMINMSINNGGWYGTISMIAPNYQNVEFFYPSGTVIPSWLENYSSSQFIYWIKLQNGIPASSSVTIYMVYFPKSDNVLNNVNNGEAPQIPCGSTPTSSCSNYAEYDDGANVFNNYWNFAGTSFPTGFTNYNNGGTSTVNNGLNISLASSGIYYGFVYNAAISPYSIVEAYSTGKRTNGPTDLGVYPSNSESVTGFAGVANTWGWGDGTISGGYGNIGNPFDISSGSGVASIYWIGTGDEGVGWNYDFVSSTYSITIPSSIYLSIGMGNNCAGSDLVYYWLRVRAYPPNGVMPSVSFGSVA